MRLGFPADAWADSSSRCESEVNEDGEGFANVEYLEVFI